MIDTFIRRYHVDMNLAQQPDPHAYEHFNAFFTRALRADARPLDITSDSALSPADGIVSQAGAIDNARIFQAKGHHYTTTDLLGGCPMHAKRFERGSFATVYLAPKDYHRVHMPVAGRLCEMIHVPGRLFSVNPLTARNVPALFARNERVVCLFDTEFGPMAVVLVGAMIVASIETVWAGVVTPRSASVTRTCYAPEASIHLAKGVEMGRFKLGSTVVVLFGPGHAQWHTKLVEGAPLCMGEGIATLNK
jgi:phosphatidylserine decarboxylase